MHVTGHIEGLINEDALFRIIEGFDAARAFTESLLKFDVGDLVHLWVNFGHRISANIMN
jgi:hypothetical protein